ncbi:MAG TPA: AMP-binding protein [Acidimicrobiia bacterium]|nr:AMP-binding protein [Acidimicrobiia bacterium]
MQDLVTTPARREEFARRELWDDTTLAGQVAALAQRRPDAVAVTDESGHRCSYAELASAAGRLAAGFHDQGIETGDVVSVQLPNWYEAAVVAVAIQSIGAVINPLLPNYRARELTHVFTTARPAAIVTPGDYRGFDHLHLVADVSDATGVRPRRLVVRPSGEDRADVSLDQLLDGPAVPLTAAGGPAEAVSELIFTSGTEASPKAILHTEQTTNFSVRVAFSDLGLSAHDVVWMPSPVGHSTGFNYGLRFALYHGLPLVLQDRWDPTAALDLVASAGASYTLAATTFLQDLVEEAQRQARTLPRLRRFGCGGAPVPAELVDAATDVGIGVLRLYGSTEVLVGTWNRPGSPGEQRRHTDGVPMTDVEIETRDADGRRCQGEPGEIFVRGPNTCAGFYADPDRTAATFDAEGWVRSGDLGVIDGDGALRVSGRKKEIIIRGGINIAPREIEDLIVAWPEVERAAVVGLPDARLGERSCACVVLRAEHSLTFEDMVGRLRDAGLATFKLPEQLVVLDALPTTASGKVQKHEIVRQLSTSVPAR